ncbi:hypothetical protein SELMODRAFT_426147 [Selaginella moellendorffii]|uniref:Uncharacterized protein n=1 Tax=Selaginella moellendorffii TaxID=88036 RepID=D8SVG8_SELML|nr:hypothetical protein SELMODRAFT_426147 [Selaginella moellendorffii]
MTYGSPELDACEGGQAGGEELRWRRSSSRFDPGYVGTATACCGEATKNCGGRSSSFCNCMLWQSNEELRRSIFEFLNCLSLIAVLIRDMSGQQLHAVAKQRRIVEVDLRVSAVLIRDMSGQQLHAVAKQRRIVEVDLRVSGEYMESVHDWSSSTGPENSRASTQNCLSFIAVLIQSPFPGGRGLPFPSRTGATSEGNIVFLQRGCRVHSEKCFAAGCTASNVLYDCFVLGCDASIYFEPQSQPRRRLPVWQELDWMEVRIIKLDGSSYWSSRQCDCEPWPTERTRSQHRPGSPSQPRAHCPLKGNAQRQDTVKFDNHFVDARVMSFKLRKLVNIEKLSHLKMYYILKQTCPRAHCPLKGNVQRQDTVKFDNHFVDTRVMSLKLRKLVNIEKLSHLKMYYILTGIEVQYSSISTSLEHTALSKATHRDKTPSSLTITSLIQG